MTLPTFDATCEAQAPLRRKKLALRASNFDFTLRNSSIIPALQAGRV